MNKPHKRDVFNVCGAWAFYQLSKTGMYHHAIFQTQGMLTSDCTIFGSFLSGFRQAECIHSLAANLTKRYAIVSKSHESNQRKKAD